MSIIKKAAVKGKHNSDVEKAEKAKAFLKEHPIPDWIVNKDRSK
jgi:hypothetical protein